MVIIPYNFFFDHRQIRYVNSADLGARVGLCPLAF